MKALTNAQLKEAAPAIFAKEPQDRVSDKYLFIPTTDIIKEMWSYGFVPVDANQSEVVSHDSSRKVISRKMSPYTRHMVKFANLDMYNKKYDGTPELVIITGHNGMVGLRGYLGFHINACSNGLVMGDISSSISTVHLKNLESQIREQLNMLFHYVKDAEANIHNYKTIELTEVEADKFAHEAHKIRFNKKSLVKPKSLLQVRRPEDDNNSLWSIFNRIQENAIQGGIPYQMDNGVKKYEQVTPPLTQINRQTAINVALWNLMTKYAK